MTTKRETSKKLEVYSDSMRNTTSRITKEQVTKLYALLDRKNPPKLTRCLEIMVALLKGARFAEPRDVATYLKSYDALMYKMQRVDPASVPTIYAEALEPEVQALEPFFTEESKEDFSTNAKYLYFFTWTRDFVSSIKLAN